MNFRDYGNVGLMSAPSIRMVPPSGNWEDKSDEEIRAIIIKSQADACRVPEAFQPSVRAIQPKHDPTIIVPDFASVYSRAVMQDSVDFTHHAGIYDNTNYAATPVAGVATVQAIAANNLAPGFCVRFDGSVLNWTTFDAQIETRGVTTPIVSDTINRLVTVEIGASALGRWFYVPFGTFDAGSSKNGRPKTGFWLLDTPIEVQTSGIPAGITGMKVRLCTAGTLALDEYCFAFGLEVR